MARAAAGRRSSKNSGSAKATSRVVRECVGVALLGLTLLLVLGLWTFAPDDPVFEAGAVTNRAGVFGAISAALLFGILGLGSTVLVAGLGYIALRLLLARGLPPPTSRFWVGAVLLVLALATFPPLAADAFPGRFSSVPAGWLGRTLAGGEGLFVGTWGALLLNGVIGAIGVLSWTGVSTGTAIGGVGVALGWLGGALAAVGLGIFEALRALVDRIRRAGRELIAGVARGFARLGVWREQRRRRARVAEAERPALAPEPEPETESSPVSQEAPPRKRGSGVSPPMIVDHAADRARENAEHQEAFRFDDTAPSGPYQLPDI